MSFVTNAIEKIANPILDAPGDVLDFTNNEIGPEGLALIAAAALTGGGSFAADGAAGAAGAGAAEAGAGAAGAGAAGSGLTQAELASLVEGGTAGTAGGGLEALALGGGGATAAQLAGIGAVGGSNAADLAAAGLGSSAGGILGKGSGLLGLSPAATGLLGQLGSAALGAYGANQQANAYKDVAEKQLALGAPYRELLLQSYNPNFSIANQPDFKNALDIGSQAAARATSANVGNPTGNPGAYADMQKYISGSLALPQLNTYRSQLGTFGTLGTNQAGTAQISAAGQTSPFYNALGAGLSSAFPQPSPLNDYIAELTKAQQLKNSKGSTA